MAVGNVEAAKAAQQPAVERLLQMGLDVELVRSGNEELLAFVVLDAGAQGVSFAVLLDMVMDLLSLAPD